MKQTKVYHYNYEQINYTHTNLIAGFDEAGRGAIAGPLVVAAVILPAGFTSPLIKDSKKLSAKQRQKAYNLIIETALDYVITIVGLAIIEKYNPKQATVMGMEVAFKNFNLQPQVCLIDFEQPEFTNFKGVSESLVQGDQKAISIAAASILAKVFRDRIMENYHFSFPEYDFARHKGYYTKLHAYNLTKYGASILHRKNYAPVKKATTFKS